MTEYVKEYLQAMNINDIPSCYYETEGIFCSIPCVASYIDDRAHRSRYRDSLTYLRALIKDLNGSCAVEIERCAPIHHTQEYGGQLEKMPVTSLDDYNSERRPVMFVTRLQGAFREESVV